MGVGLWVYIPVYGFCKSVYIRSISGSSEGFHLELLFQTIPYTVISCLYSCVCVCSCGVLECVYVCVYVCVKIPNRP